MKRFFLRVVILLVGLTIAHLGVTLFLLSDLGADPFNVLIQGLFRVLQKPLPFLTHGTTHVAVCLLIVAVLLIVDRSYVKLGTLLCMVFGGPIIDLFTWILSPLQIGAAPLWIKIPVLALGCVILAYGMTIVIKSEAGTGPNDLVAVVLSDKTKVRFGIMRIVVDFSFVVLGWLMGGVFGVGTLICAFLVGPVADFFLPKNEALIRRLLEKVPA